MELVWAKVPGWSWWPAVVLPVPENGRETRGNKAIIKVEDNERVVLFLVDKTVARVPRELPAFTQHYTRFLSATYANKKLFQAVEEARALVYEGSVAAAQLKEAEQLSMISYPPPVRDDFRKSGRQLLQWLKAAAVDPAAPVNKLSDQANKRVLHAVHNNRRVTEDMKPFVLPTEVPAAVAPAAAVHAGNQGPAVAETTTEQLPAKRQRRPHSWLQQYGDLPPALAQSTTAAAAQQPPAGSKTAGAGGSAAGGGAAAASRQGPANGYTLAGKANGQLARLKQMSTKVKDGQQGKAAAADSELLANGRSKGRKRARSTTVDGHDAADDSGSDEEGQDYALLSDSNSDDDVERPLQQRRLQDRALCASAAQKLFSMTHRGPAEQQNPRGKQRRLMDLMVLCESAKAGGVSKAAAAAAAVAAAFRGGRSADCDPAAAGSSGVDEGHNSRPQAGSKGSETRIGRKQQQQQVLQKDSDSESDADSDLLDCRDARGLSGDATGRVFSRLKQRQPESVYGGLQRRYSMQQQPQRARAGIIPAVVNGELRCNSPQLLRQSGPSAASRCTCGCCYCQQHRRQQQEQQRLQQQRQQHAALDSAVDHVLGDWLQSDQDMLNATDGLQQQQQPMAGEADGGDSLVDVQAFADRGLLSSTQEDCLTSPASLITAAGAPLRPTAVRLAGAGSNRACSIPHLRPPSPLLGAAPVMTVGDELLPGLEEDLQHAAAIFGSSSGKESSCQPGQQQQQSDGEPPGQQNQCEEVIAGAAAGAAAAAVEGYMSDGASAAAAAADSPGLIDLDLQPTLLTDDAVNAAAAAGSMHPDSPSTASHDTLLLPSWELDVIKTGPQDSELQAEIAAAAAASSAGAAKAGAAAAAVEIPPVLGFRRSVSQRSASSTGDDVRRLALARCNSSNKTPDLQTQLEDCKEQLHASTEIVRQLKQQLDAKDDQIAALCSQTSAQAKQLQQQAGELMALRALLGKQQKLPANAGVTTTTAVTAAAASDAPSGVQQAGKDSSGATAAAEAHTVGATDQTEQAAAPADHGGDAASAPVRRSGRLSAAAARAAVRDLLELSDAAVAGTTDGVSMLAGGQQQQQQQTDVSHLRDKDACSDPRELQQQLHQANTLITNLQKQLQQATKQATAATKQQQAEAEQLRSWLQAAEIDAALVRSENELLKKALPSSVVASVAATAACKPADKATAGRARSKASEGGSSGRKQSGGRPSAAGKAGVAVKGKAAAGAAVEGNASATAARGPAAASATAQQVAALAAAAAAAASTPTSPLAAAAANKACNVFSRRPKMQLPLQTIALPTSNAANAQTLAAALAALKDATAGSNAISVGNSSSSSTLTIPASLATTTTTVSSPTAASTGTALLSLAAAAGGAGVANVGGPVVVFRPSGALQLATMLQVNAALSQLAALNAAGANKPAAAAAVAPLVLKPPTLCSPPPPPPAAAATAAAAAGCSANPTAASGSNAAATGSTTSAAGGGGVGCRSSSRPAVLMLGDTPPPSTSNGSVLTAVRACTITHSDKAGSMQAVQKTGTAAPAGLVLSKAASAAAVAGVVGAAKATDSQAM